MIFLRKYERALILVCSSLALLVVTSCRSQNNSPARAGAANDTVVSSTPPFQTKEPERYRATRTITSVTADGRTNVIKHSIAKDGETRRIEFEVMSNKLVFLDVPLGRFVLLPEKQIYAEGPREAIPGTSYEDESSPERLLHTENGNSSYQKIGTELIAGRNINKYRVVVNESNAANVSQSETLIWIDEALGMPIRSETKSSDGSHSLMELSEIALDFDKRLFQIPEGYQKVTFLELMERLRSGQE
jgi:hypothetical protein